MKKLARELRRNSTDAERVLWKHLRDRRLAGHKFRRQQQIGPYIVDFVCLELQLIVEADGGQHSQQKRYDAQRTIHLESEGYRVIRFWNHEILQSTDEVLAEISRCLVNHCGRTGGYSS